jgi:uncharacterized protein YidB (DUF937 family)
MDFYNYILNNLPHRNDQEKTGIGTALSVLFGHPHPQETDVQPNEDRLTDILGRFNQAGLGNKTDSWVGTGPNEAIDPRDVQRALGDHEIQQMAHQSGMSVTQLLPLLAQYLPMIVDRMTPNGQLPQRGGGGLLGALSGMLGKR